VYHSLVVMPIVRRAYVAAVLMWAMTLPLATYAATRVHATTATHLYAFIAYTIGSLVCHQKPDRSFHLWATRMPVCARCTGIYLGAVAGILLRSAKAARSTLLLASLPTIATLVFEWITGVTPSNTVRFAAGLPLGMVVSWLVVEYT